jgi:hypothetical protein
MGGERGPKIRGGAGPTKNTDPKAQAPTAQKPDTGLTASHSAAVVDSQQTRAPLRALRAPLVAESRGFC